MSQSPPTRNSLILRLKDHDDAEAWGEFIASYEPLVYRMMMRAGLQSADAVEQTQEVMAAVAQAINRWEPDERRGRFRTWLYRVSKNILADFWKKHHRSPVSGIDSKLDVPQQDSSDGFDSAFEQQVFLVAVQKVKPQVHTKTWRAFWSSAVEKLSVDLVAEELDMTPGSVYVARSRVMKKLQDAVRSFLKTRLEN